MAGYRRGNNRFDPYDRPSYDYYDDPRRYDDYAYRRPAYPEYDYDRYDDWEMRSRRAYDYPPAAHAGYDRRHDGGGRTSIMAENAKLKVTLKKPDRYTKDNTIIVSGVPLEYCRFRQKDIIRMFEKCGNIIQNVIFPKDSKMGDNKASIIVTYESNEQAQNAIKELDGFTFGSNDQNKSDPVAKMETEPVPKKTAKGISCCLKKPDKYTKDNAVLVQDIPEEICAFYKREILTEFEKYGTIIQKTTFNKDEYGRYKGLIVVIYENNEQAQAAIKAMDGYVFDASVAPEPEPEVPKDTIIYKDDCTEPNIPLSITEADSNSSLRVRNIPSFCRTDDVMKLFEKYGPICFDINLIDDPAADVGTLTCLIIYQKAEEAKNAMENLNGYRYDKSQVFVPSIPISVKYYIKSRGITRKRNKETSCLTVSNIPRSFGIKDLEKLFNKYGTVKRKIDIPRDKYTGESRGFSHIDYETVSEAQAAKRALDGVRIEVSKEEYYDYYYGTDTARELYERITVKPCTTESHGRTIYLAGIPLYFSEWKANEAVKKCFSKFGAIEIAKIPRGKGTGDIRGMAFITYEEKEHAEAAIEAMNDKLVSEAFSSDIPSFQKKPYDHYPGSHDSRTNNPYGDYNWDRSRMNQGNALSALSEPRRGQGDSDPSFEAMGPSDKQRAADAMSFLAAPADPMSFLTLPAGPKSAAAGSSATSAPTSSQRDADYNTVVTALTSLKNVCSYLPILGPSLREALNASVEQNHDANGVLAFFQAKDTHGLLELVLVKLENLQKNKSNKDNRQIDLFTDAIKCIGVLQGTIELPKPEKAETMEQAVEETANKSQEDYSNSERNYHQSEENYNKEEDYNYPDRKFESFKNVWKGHGNSQESYNNSQGNYGNSQGNYGNQGQSYGNMEADYSNNKGHYNTNENYHSQQNYEEYDDGNQGYRDENYRNW